MFEKGGQHYARCGQCGLRSGRSSANRNFQERIEDFEPAYLGYLSATAVDEVNHDATIGWIEAHKPLGPSVSLLDVGAGSGKFLRHLGLKRPCRTLGLEPSRALFSAFDLAGKGLVGSTLPEFAAAYAGVPFDVVTVLDVVEHVEAPVEFVRGLRAVTKPGSLVFLSTPDAGSLVARVLGRRWHHYNRYHLSLFDRRSMGRLATLGGFETIEVRNRGKRFTAGYLQDYVRDFLFPGRAVRAAPRRTDIAFPLNIFDVMWAVWKRDS